MRHFFPQVTDAARITAFAEEKEAIYRRLCREDAAGLHLIEGLPETLDRLRARGVPMVIATGAGQGNMDLYFEAFRLERWFDWQHIIYDDGTLAGKPDPDVYLAPCARLGVAPAECVSSRTPTRASNRPTRQSGGDHRHHRHQQPRNARRPARRQGDHRRLSRL